MRYKCSICGKELKETDIHPSGLKHKSARAFSACLGKWNRAHSPSDVYTREAIIIQERRKKENRKPPARQLKIYKGN